jgi:hypothetical protein
VLAKTSKTLLDQMPSIDRMEVRERIMQEESRYPRRVAWIRSPCEEEPNAVLQLDIPGEIRRDGSTKDAPDLDVYVLDISNPGFEHACQLMMTSMLRHWHIAVAIGGRRPDGKVIVKHVSLGLRLIPEPPEV